MFTKLINSAATNNAQSIQTIKRGAGVWAVNAYNAGGAAAYVKLYDKFDLPVPGTDTPAFVLAVPASGNARLDLNVAMQFKNGIGLAIVTGAADTDNTAVAANQVKVAVVHG